MTRALPSIRPVPQVRFRWHRAGVALSPVERVYVSLSYVSLSNRHAFNDVIVLNVHRSRGMFTSSGSGALDRSDGSGGRGGDAAFSSSSERAHPARRRRYSSDSDSDCEQPEGTPTLASHHGYTYTWVHPMVRGRPPVGRLAHSSAVVRLLNDSEGGSESGQQAYMMVFGGVGTGQVFNDVAALRCVNDDIRSDDYMLCFSKWPRTSALPRPPSRSHKNALCARMCCASMGIGERSVRDWVSSNVSPHRKPAGATAQELWSGSEFSSEEDDPLGATATPWCR